MIKEINLKNRTTKKKKLTMSVLIKPGQDRSIISVIPYNQEIIHIIQEYKHRKYNSKTKEFSMLNEDIGSFKDKLHDYGYTWTDNKENLISNNNDNNARVKYGLNNKGNYWLVGSNTSGGAVNEVLHYGIIPR